MGSSITKRMARERRRRRVLAGAVVIAVALGVPAPAQGQSGGAEASPERGVGALWYGVTIGGAGTRLTCDLCQPGRDLGPAVSVSLGAHARPDLRIGLEGGAWTHEGDGVRETTWAFGLVAHLVPHPSRGLYLLGGAGWTAYQAGDFGYDAPRVTVGLGWDVPLFGRWVAGNVLALDGSAFGSLKNEGTTVVRDVGLSALRLAIQLRRN